MKSDSKERQGESLEDRSDRINGKNQTVKYVREDCADVEILKAYRAKELSENHKDAVEGHLSGCQDCRDTLLSLALEEAGTPIPDTTDILGKAIAVAAVGPDGLSSRLVKKAARAIGALEATEIDDEDGRTCFALEVGSGIIAGNPVDATKLIAWCRKLKFVLNLHKKVGIVLGAGPGYISEYGPFGAVIEETLDQLDRAIPSKLLVAADLSETFRALGLKTRSAGEGLEELLLPGGDTDIEPDRQAPHQPRPAFEPLVAIVGWGEKVFGWIRGNWSAPDGGVALTVRPLRATREGGQQANALMRGDRFQIDYRVPADAWVYLLWQRESRLELPRGETPIRKPGGTTEGQDTLYLDDRQDDERPLVLIAEEEIVGLGLAVQQVNQREKETADLRAQALLSVIEESLRVKDCALLHGGVFKHVSFAAPALPPALRQARAALDKGEYPDVVYRCQAFLEQGEALDLEARAYLYMGRALESLEQLDKAESALAAGARAARDAGTGRLAASIERELAWVLLAREEPEEALRFYERALAGHHEARDAQAEARDHLLGGRIFWVKNRFREAHECFTAALEICRQTREESVEADARLNLGTLCLDLGRYEEAFEHVKKALTMFRKTDERRSQMLAHYELAQISVELRHPEQALVHHRVHMRLALEIGTPLEVGIARRNLALALILLKEFAEARECLAAAVKALDNAGRGGRTQLDCTRMIFAMLELAEGHIDAAGEWLGGIEHESALPLDALLRLHLIRARWREQVSPGLAAEDYEKGIALLEAQRVKVGRGLRSSLLEIGVDLAEGWLSHLVRMKCRPEQILDTLARVRSRAFVDALAQSNRVLESIRHSEEKGGSAAADRGSSVAEELVAKLVPVDELRSRLEPGVGFLLFHSLPEQLLIFALSGEKVELHTGDVSRDRLARLCEDVRLWCRTPSATTRVLEGLRRAPGFLARLLLEPLEPFFETLPEETVLGVVVNEPLYSVPMHALPLPWAKGSNAPLIMSHPMFYCPSLQAVYQWIERPASRNTQALVLADPLEDLPSALVEGRRVAELLKCRKALEGEAATMQALASQGRQARFIHISAHGNKARIGRGAALQLAPDQRLAKELVEELRQTRKPGQLRAELGEAGAEWLSKLKLDADLVVTAACESSAGGLGRACEGVTLLSWALLVAGARSVVAAAWRIGDETTEAMIYSFYQKLLQGQGRALALAQAQREWINGTLSVGGEPGEESPTVSEVGREHPYFWGGLSLMGDWRKLTLD